MKFGVWCMELLLPDYVVCSLRDFVYHVVSLPKYSRSCFSQFFPEDTHKVIDDCHLAELVAVQEA